MRRARVRTPQTPPGHLVRFGARVFDAARHDPYQARRKQAGTIRCDDCGAIFHDGRWQWSTATSAAGGAVCPACRRIRDKLPAGFVTLEGPFVAAHRAELVRIVQNEAERERSEHPLHRIIDLAGDDRRVELSTTDIHLPQRIGAALRRAHGGKLTVKYAKDAYGVRVRWQG